MKRALRLISIYAALSTACFASEMDRVVHNLELELGVRHTHIPFLGVAMFMGKVATGFQMPGAKIAIFEDERLGDASPQQIEQAMLKSLGPQWTPIVKSISRHGKEQNWIYFADNGKKLQMFIASVERNELSLVEVKVSERQMRRWIDEPQEMARKR